MTPEQNAARQRAAKGLGEHNLSNICPFDDSFKQWKLEATQEERDELFQADMAHRGEVAYRS